MTADQNVSKLPVAMDDIVREASYNYDCMT